ncbi:P-loop NTPase fold protein [Amycolatopsis japonica]|uniref:KAP family P-loop NTPase fold protein n=1 Tax=Amycolatopsis japonica TaxID=208439 RepID=UPI00366C9C00
MTATRSSGLWSDEPTKDDLLSFDAVADTVVDAVLDDTLDPLAIGVSGAWGSGKTTILRLIEADLDGRQLPHEQKILVIRTDPWRYDPTAGAKETLIGEVLTKLAGEVKDIEGTAGKAKTLLTKLRNRVDWSKALQVAAKASLALQLPSVDDLTSLVKKGGGGDSKESESRGLAEFHTEFEDLMDSKELTHLVRVVVLVDDLDRCLYPTVVDTLETIRLFLAVPKMAFVIAADEKRVADALRERFSNGPTNEQAPDGQHEHPADLYLHKIVQTTVPLPALSRFDTEAYMVLLQLKARLEEAQLMPYVERCAALRREAGVLDDLPAVDTSLDISAELTLASRLTPILYEKLRGNPRRIKRFLNDLRVRQSVASRRGITLDADIVAKLMVLEVLLPDDFAKVLEWLAKGELREQIRALETAAGRPPQPEEEQLAQPAEAAVADDIKPKTRAKSSAKATEPEPTSSFTDDLIRWAKLTPSELSGEDLAPYLFLAASFSGKPLLDEGLPARLRDVAAKLVSSIRAQQKAVTDDDIGILTEADAEVLVRHLALAARDRPTEQQAAMLGIMRIVKRHPQIADAACGRLRAIPPSDLEPGALLLFKPEDRAVFGEVFDHWFAAVPEGPVKNTLKPLVKKQI